MKAQLNIAIQAARAGGKIILQHSDRPDTLKINEKRQNDFVTNIDYQSERAILEVIHKHYPNHAILAEETGKLGENESDYEWIIDPLDGTKNYIHSFPHYAVSIALKYKGVLTVGVVYDPLREELFTASRGDGAYLNSKRLRVSQHRSLSGALIGTGFSCHHPATIGPSIHILRSLLEARGSIRRAGSAALDLAYIAAGRLDGFWEFSLKPWDIAAGILLITEAGGLLTDCEGGENYWETGNVLTGTPPVFKQMLSHLRQAHKNI